MLADPFSQFFTKFFIFSLVELVNGKVLKHIFPKVKQYDILFLNMRQLTPGNVSNINYKT